MKAGQGAARAGDGITPSPDFPRLLAAQYAHFDEDVPLWLALARRQGEPILELGCGSGRVLEALLHHGHAVFGLDHDPGMLRLTKQSLSPQFADKVRLIQADLRSFAFGAAFPLILIACNTFAELDDPDASAALRCIRAHLSVEGMLALDLPHPTGWEWEAEDGPLMSYTDPASENPVQVYARQTFVARRMLCRVDWRYDELLPDGRLRQHEMHTDYHLRAPEQMRALLEAAGYAVWRFYGGYKLEAYHADSQRLIVLAASNPSSTLPPPR